MEEAEAVNHSARRSKRGSRGKSPKLGGRRGSPKKNVKEESSEAPEISSQKMVKVLQKMEKEKAAALKNYDKEDTRSNQNYQRLILDALNSVKFLNSSLSMGQLERVVSIFRNNIFQTPADADFVPTPKQLSEYLLSELEAEDNTMKLVVENSYGGDVV
mmetsp:Transcript_41821/g.63940  ORF Transcript_41821/g.63940 Transcript_41821/m.63940 type:complete len:159 (+) Transcript_41821:179-655(+)